MDKRKNNGGHSTKGKAGRKPKAEEIKLIERLDNIIDKDEAVQTLHKLLKDGNFNALKLYLEYRWGKPKESLDVTSKGESLSFNELVNFGSNSK